MYIKVTHGKTTYELTVTPNVIKQDYNTHRMCTRFNLTRFKMCFVLYVSLIGSDKRNSLIVLITMFPGHCDSSGSIVDEDGCPLGSRTVINRKKSCEKPLMHLL